MKQIYTIGANPNECQDVLIVNADAKQVYEHLRSTQRQQSFGVITLRRDPDSQPCEIKDAFAMTASALIVSERFYAQMHLVIDQSCVEWIPCKFEGARVWLLHVVAVVEAVDEVNSELERLPSGRVMRIKNLCIKRNCLGSENVFRLGAGLESWWPLVTGEVVQAINDSQLTGFQVEQIDIS